MTNGGDNMASFAELLDKAMTEVGIGNQELAACIDLEKKEGGRDPRTIGRWRHGEKNKKGEPYKPTRQKILDMIKPLCLKKKGMTGLEECNALLRAVNKVWGLDEDEQQEYFPNLKDEPPQPQSAPPHIDKEPKEDKFSKIRDNIRDQTHIIEDKIQDFVGRKFVFDEIEDFIDTKSRGYFIVRGDPGIGKSALSAQFVKTTGCVHHFNVRAEGISTASKFLTNICAQLIVAYDLDYQTLPPETAQDSGFLSNLLEHISKKLSSDEKLVIVVDALDEVDTTDATTGANVLYLPIMLPTGVYIVATMRRDKDVNLRIQCEQQMFEIKQDDARNIADISERITHALKHEGIQTYISKQQIDNEGFVVHLTKTSQGNFIYLRYVLSEIEHGAYTDLALNAIPIGLQNYYRDHWQRMKGRDEKENREWFDYKLKVVVGLTITKSPISIDLIVDYSCVQKRSYVRTVLKEWRAFLYEDEMQYKEGMRKRYRMYHDSFRDFLGSLEEIEDERVDLMAAKKKFSNTMWLEVFGDE